jgi:hypothetical protein
MQFVLKERLLYKEVIKDLEINFIVSRENTIPAEGGVTGIATTFYQ